MTGFKVFSKVQFSTPKQKPLFDEQWCGAHEWTLGSDSTRTLILMVLMLTCTRSRPPQTDLTWDSAHWWYLTANCAVRGQCGVSSWLFLSRFYLREQKGPDMWHRLPNLCGFNWLSRSIVHQIRRGNISTCLLISSKGLHIQTSTAHSRCSDICSADKSLWCARHEKEYSAIFGCIVHWCGEWRNRKANLTAPDKGSACLLRPTYINLLLLRQCWVYIYLYTCLRWYQRAAVDF